MIWSPNSSCVLIPTLVDSRAPSGTLGSCAPSIFAATFFSFHTLLPGHRKFRERRLPPTSSNQYPKHIHHSTKDVVPPRVYLHISILVASTSDLGEGGHFQALPVFSFIYATRPSSVGHSPTSLPSAVGFLLRIPLEKQGLWVCRYSPRPVGTMDHTDRIRQNLELLGLESLHGLSLGKLLHEVDESFPLDISKKRVLHVFMAWLNERLMVIDNSDENALKEEISEWCSTLRACSYDDQILASAFNDFQREQAVIEPSSSRRLDLARLEIRDFLDNHPQPASPLPPNPKQEPDYQIMHPDRAMLSQRGDRDRDRIVIDLDDWEPGSVDRRSLEDEGTEMVRFLTGANKMVYEDNMRRPDHGSRWDSSMRSRNEHGPDSHPEASWNQAALSGSLDHRAVSHNDEPFNGYVCDRCGTPGHRINRCPTNLDSSFDKKPSKTYSCKLCHRRGDHYLSLCPLNDRFDSITQQRRRAFGTPSPHRESESQSQSRRREKEKQFGLRDNSPPPHLGNRRSGDRYRPRDSRARSRSPVFTRTSRTTRVRDYSRENSPEYDTDPLNRSIPLHLRGQNEGRLSFFDDCEGAAELPPAELNGRLGHHRAPLEQLEFWQENVPRPNNMLQDRSPEDGECHEKDAVSSDMTDLEEFIHQHASSVPPSTVEVPSQTVAPPPLVVKESGDTSKTANWQNPDPSSPRDGQVMEPEQPLPIVLGVTIKSLDREPPYDPAILELFKHRENVWVRRIKRNLAADIFDEDEAKEGLRASTHEVDPHKSLETGNEAALVNPQELSMMTTDDEIPAEKDLSGVAEGSDSRNNPQELDTIALDGKPATQGGLFEVSKTENLDKETQDLPVAASDEENHEVSQPFGPEVLAVSTEKLHSTPEGAEEAQFESVMTEVESLQLFEGEPPMDAARADSAMDVDENDVSRISNASSTTVAAQVDTVMTEAEPLRDFQPESATEAA
ncbi:hypothetical protein B0T19DRAFT_210127 [Cercophora scortea]|uniref:CCHC-type domain-containing protein n=1 Tax=Cercophora scortea TaxID=314031 RepID=A0AAE0IEG2_9PEZI|nr:hypothetical protein B0T19DRAFT_210127 [Cercophora scortea]